MCRRRAAASTSTTRTTARLKPARRAQGQAEAAVEYATMKELIRTVSRSSEKEAIGAPLWTEQPPTARRELQAEEPPIRKSGDERHQQDHDVTWQRYQRQELRESEQ